MRIATRRFALAAALLGLVVGVTGPARANLILDIQESGGNVVGTGTGTANLAALTSHFSSEGLGLVDPSGETVVLGPTSLTSGTAYSGITGPASFGTGGLTLANSGSGGVFGVFLTGNLELELPAGYASGDSINSTSTWDSTTFSGLGLTPGTYVYTWGSGDTADSLTLQIGPAAAPEPSTLAGAATGLLLVIGYTWRKRRRARLVA